MMNRPFNQIVVVVLIALIGSEAIADKLLVEVSGVYTPAPNPAESPGRQETSLPVSLELLVDESQGQYIPAGAALIDGQTVVDNSLVLPASAVLSLNANLGNYRWTESDIQPLPLSDLGFRPGIILMGDIGSDSVRIFCFLANEEKKTLSLSLLTCRESNCVLEENGFGEDLQSNSSGFIDNLTVSVSRATRSSMR